MRFEQGAVSLVMAMQHNQAVAVVLREHSDPRVCCEDEGGYTPVASTRHTGPSSSHGDSADHGACGSGQHLPVFKEVE